MKFLIEGISFIRIKIEFHKEKNINNFFKNIKV